MVTDVHQGELVDFRMKVVRRHQSALFRQVHEAVRIHRISQVPEVNILNSKGEYNRCKLPRLQVAEEFKDSNEQGGTKYTLSSKQKKVKLNDDREIKERKDKHKLNDFSSDNDSQIESQSSSISNDFKVDNSKAALQQTESKPNMVGVGEDKNQSRRVYKFVANNYRFKKKYNVRPLSAPER